MYIGYPFWLTGANEPIIENLSSLIFFCELPSPYLQTSMEFGYEL
jgi:hypothetical protein